MPQKYIYTYFNIKGRGEMVRLIFAAAGVKYEDKRIEFSEWAKFKAGTPVGGLPVLEIDGKTFPESVVITRHLAREFGLDGKTNIEKIEADVIVELAIQLREAVIKIHFEKDEAKKAELGKVFAEETIPKLFGFIDKTLTGNTNGNGFLVGNQLSWADIVVVSLCDMLALIPEILPKFPKMAAHQKKIEALPKIAAYIKARPVTSI